MSAAAELARFLGIPVRLPLSKNAVLGLRDFTARTHGAAVYIDASYVRIGPRGETGEEIKRFEVREVDE